MGLFRKKKDNVLDLTEAFEKEKEKLIKSKEPSPPVQQQQNAFGFFGNFGSNSVSQTPNSFNSQPNVSSEYADLSEGDRKKKLAKRLVNMTEKIEDLSNQIYHLQQRIEVLERKAGVKFSQ